nr:MAG TPA: hypothetical protein [Caudoviricetes sp.]
MFRYESNKNGNHYSLIGILFLMFCKMLETEKIQRINQQLEEVSRKINANSGI